MKCRSPISLWLSFLVLLSFLFSTSAMEKIIRAPIVTDYGVDDPQFLRSMSQQLHAGLTRSNSVTELINGAQIFPAMLAAISKATNSITFENFIWRSGNLSDRFVAALTARARDGVKVHCIVDSFGAWKLKHSDRRKLRDAGVQLDIFNPIHFWNFWTWNHRTHRKTLVVDGKVGFIGGICIADEWDGNASEPNHWRDTEFRVEGPVVGEIQGVFMDNWMRVQSEVLHGNDYFPALEPQGNLLAQCFKSGPEDGAENARLLYLYSIAAARKSIRLSHSYFVPDNLAIDLLVAARKRGVKIEIITPGRIDFNIVRRAARSRWGKLLDAGVEFYEFQPSKYHCKQMIVDDLWVTSGSINFDDRSFRINGEANLNVYDPAFAARQIEIFEQDKSKSLQITKEKFDKRPLRIKFIENFCGLFRGLL